VKVYVAGASAERSEVSKYMQLLRDAGIEITLDWIAVIDAQGGAANEGMTGVQRHKAAKDDLKGVSDADIVWLIVPNNYSAGAWVELGYALGIDKTVIASGNYERSIFTSHCDCEFTLHDDALAWIIDCAKQAAREETP
jgi:nucleoside 2-deoxyribosyltransferase